MKNPEFDSCFTVTGKIASIRKAGRSLHLLVQQNVAGKLPTTFKVVYPAKAGPEFSYRVGDTVLLQDMILYQKDGELRLKVPNIRLIRHCQEQDLLNTLSFSGRVTDVTVNKAHRLIILQQTVADRFETTLEVLIPSSVPVPVKKGDVGYIRSAFLYQKNGLFRAKIENESQYKCLYSPDKVNDLGTVEAKERFAI